MRQVSRKMPRRLAALAALIAAATTLLALAPAGASAASPWWQIVTGARPSILPSGGEGRITLSLINIGDGALDASKVPLAIEDELPEGVLATEVAAFAGAGANLAPSTALSMTPLTSAAASKVLCPATKRSKSKSSSPSPPNPPPPANRARLPSAAQTPLRPPPPSRSRQAPTRLLSGSSVSPPRPKKRVGGTPAGPGPIPSSSPAPCSSTRVRRRGRPTACGPISPPSRATCASRCPPEWSATAPPRPAAS